MDSLISIRKKITVEDTNARLVFREPFLLIDVTINDTYAGRMMFNSSLDISSYLKKGENEIKLTITLGNKNLLGPFHTIDELCGFVGPDTFERFGSWENGRSRYYNESYSFFKEAL